MSFVPPIIALHAFAQCGKDTAADFLKPYGYNRLAFADNIRSTLYKTNPEVKVFDNYWRLQKLVDQHGWDWSKVHVREVRRLLQEYGMAARENYGENHWVNQVIGQCVPGERQVITDLRFANEYKALTVFGPDVLFVKIKRPGFGPVNEHVSDAGLADDLFDRIIINDGSLQDLRKNLLASVGII